MNMLRKGKSSQRIYVCCHFCLWQTSLVNHSPPSFCQVWMEPQNPSAHNSIICSESPSIWKPAFNRLTGIYTWSFSLCRLLVGSSLAHEKLGENSLLIQEIVVGYLLYARHCFNHLNKESSPALWSWHSVERNRKWLGKQDDFWLWWKTSKDPWY